MLRPVVHVALHLALPGLLARWADRERPLRAWLIMLASAAVDLDHLLAEPIYDPERCSLGFHPLHSWPMQPVYVALALWPATRLVGLGLVLHMALDGLDCLWMAAG